MFDVIDDFVDDAYRAGSKRWLTALRDSIAFKIGYAYGLRRRELVMLDLTDFGPNPHVPGYGNYGALTVRWAKGTKGSGPRRSERGGRLTISALGRSFAAFRQRAGLPPELSLHALRHSYTTHLIEAGYDPLFVQQQLGHSFASTTSLYTSVTSDFKQRVVQQMIARRLRMENADG